jgi:hypothetical protein
LLAALSTAMQRAILIRTQLQAGRAANIPALGGLAIN